jgi:hypothetical protein
MSQQPSHKPEVIGDILKKIVRKDGFGKKALKGRRLAQKVIAETLGPQAEHVAVASVRVGVVTLEADSSALFQEVESFQRERLTNAFRTAGLKVREIRVTLAQ